MRLQIWSQWSITRSMKQTLRALPSALFVGLALLTGAGCDPIKRLRHTIHGEEQSTADGASGAGANAGISVTVQPPSGVSILIDGIKVATQSPYDANNLEPGTHTLLVRGMGYQTITLPVELKKQDTLKVPIALLQRPQIHPAPPLPDDEDAPPPREERPPERPRPRPRPQPAPTAPDLPQGMAALDLQLIAQPATPVLLDGQRLDGKTLRIRKQNGLLQVGNLTLVYLVTDSRVLDLTVPNDDGTYNRDGVPLPAGSVIHLTHGATRIHRTGDNEQAVILKRNN